MLESLSIKNFLLIDEIFLNFECGMTVITGETGAGKSLILSAINFVLGSKSNPKMLRMGSDFAVVSASFTNLSDDVGVFLSTYGIAYEKQLILKRVFFKDKNSKFFLNDEPVSSKFVQSLQPFLVEIHGQRDSLLDSKDQINLLDYFAGISDLRAEISAVFDDTKQIFKRLKEISEKITSELKHAEYIKSCIKELETADIKDGEEDALITQRIASKNKQKSLAILSEVDSLCDISDLIKASKVLSRAELGFQEINQAIDCIDEAISLIDKACGSIDGIRKTINSSEISIDEIEERLMSLRDLARKHHCTVSQLPSLLISMKNDVLNIEALISEKTKLELELTGLDERYDDLANKINIKRTDAAKLLSANVNDTLKYLRLENCHFLISVDKSGEKGALGQDRVRFLVSTNLGMPLTPIESTASGGELARIMLALKVAFANILSAGVFVFDEIDSGTGGIASSSIGKVLYDLSQGKQVIAITHSPQVAVYADQHILVEKQIIDEKNVTKARNIFNQERVQTVAKMLTSDEVETDEALKVSKALFLTSKKTKS